MGKTLALLLKDLLKAAAVGAGIALALSLLLAGGGFLYGGAAAALETVRNGLLLVFSLLLLVVAGMLLIRGKNPERFRLGADWKKHFSVIGPKTMLLSVAAGMLAVIIIADYLQLAAG